MPTLCPHVTTSRVIRRLAVLAALLLVTMLLPTGVANAASCGNPKDPNISVSPPQGPPGTRVTVSGRTAAGDRVLVDGLGPRAQLAAVPADGVYSIGLTVPAQTPPGCYQLQVTTAPPSGGLGSFSFAEFTVTAGTPPPGNGMPPPASCPNATLRIVGDPGPIGTTFRIEGSGWLSPGTVAVRLPYGSPGIFHVNVHDANIPVPANGIWSLTETVGEPTPPGSYVFTATEDASQCAGGHLQRTVSYGVTNPAPAPADLQPTAITFDKSLTVVSKTIHFDSGIRNTGGTDTGVFNVKWLVDGREVGAYGSHAGVPTGATVLNGNSQFDWKFTQAGHHSVTFIVDADNHVAESNENNNRGVVAVDVAQAPSAGLGLPFPAGTRVYIGPKEAHADNFRSLLDERTGAVFSFGNRDALASLDIVLNGDQVGTAKVAATALDSGTVLAVWNTCQVLLVDHNGTWVTYLHLAGITVRSGEVVNRGTPLGYPTTVLPPTTPCGAVTATAEHVHIAMATGSGRVGNYEPIVGKSLCGSTVGTLNGAVVLAGLTATRGEKFTVPDRC